MRTVFPAVTPPSPLGLSNWPEQLLSPPSARLPALALHRTEFHNCPEFPLQGGKGFGPFTVWSFSVRNGNLEGTDMIAGPTGDERSGHITPQPIIYDDVVALTFGAALVVVHHLRRARGLCMGIPWVLSNRVRVVPLPRVLSHRLLTVHLPPWMWLWPSPCF